MAPASAEAGGDVARFNIADEATMSFVECHGLWSNDHGREARELT